MTTQGKLDQLFAAFTQASPAARPVLLARIAGVLLGEKHLPQNGGAGAA